MARRPDSLSRANRQRLTQQRKLAFLHALRACGVATRAAREASPNARGNGVVSTFKDERARDPEFAAEWDAALEEHAGSLVAELYRRATIGDAVPIVSPTGEVVGFKHNRSDTLLLAAVRAHAPEFTPRTESTVEQTVTQRKPSDLSLRLEELTPDERRKLREVLESSLARRNGTEHSSNGHAPSSGLSIPERER
ncbi:MAG: hypothetical protein GC161_15970 [Planctomycetaceae bacterium]|nr:hypothetical protein [Planctomycetaceae bacterium]